MKKILFGIIFLITIATYSQESKEEGKDYGGWIFMTSQDNGDEIYYQTFKKDYTWFKTVYNKPKEHKELFVEKPHTITGHFTLYKFDCDAKEMGVKSRGYLTKEAVVDSNQTADVLITMEVPFPDTMAEFYLNYFCDNIKD
jgi:hypothetical protein